MSECFHRLLSHRFSSGFLVVVPSLLIFAVVASAHDFWSDGSLIDPVTKRWCCNEADHFAIEETQVRRVDKGYRVTGRFLTVDGPVGLDQIVEFQHVFPSPDGRFHVFLGDGVIRCFFAPIFY
jgi:hypothetical protein